MAPKVIQIWYGVALAMLASPASAEILYASDWQAKLYRLTHRNKQGNFDQNKNYAYLIHDYHMVRNAMTTGYARAFRFNDETIANGKAPLFCPPPRAKGGKVALSSGDINKYLSSLPIEYRKKTTMVDAMVGFVIAQYPCAASSKR